VDRASPVVLAANTQPHLLLASLVVCPSSEVVALVVVEVTEPNLYALVLGWR
jgi:hypothetical protein